MKVEQAKPQTTDGAEYAFSYDNGALDVGRIPHNAGEWNLEFEFNPSSAVQNHISPQLYQRELNDTKTGPTISNKNSGELKNGHSESLSNHNLVSHFNIIT